MGGFAEKNGRAGSPLPAASLAETAWPMIRLGDVCEEIRERIPSSKVSREGYITTDNMVKGCGGVRISESLPVGVGLVKYQAGDILLSNIRPYLKKVWLADHGGGCSSDVIVFRVASSGLSPEYLYRALSQDAFFDYSMQNVSGTKMPRGKRDWIKQFEFALPPLSVQREIVERLEKELGETEKITAGFRRIAENAEAEFKAELDEKFKALEDDVSRGGAETRRVRLGDVCETGSGGTPLSSNREYYDGGDVPWLRSGEICKRDIGNTEYCITKKGLNSSSAKIFPADSVVVAMYGATAGQVGILRIASSTNQAICAILPSEKFVPEFLYYQLCWLNDEMVSQAQGGAQPNISQIKIKNLNVVWPILSLQQASISRLDAARERCDKIKAEAEKGLKAAENLRKAILKEAFEQ